jgi:predicted DNA-binding ribbon-helix-helix protein
VAVPRTVRLPEATWTALAARAEAQGLTLAQLVATLAAA